MKKIMFVCAVFLTLAVTVEAQSDTLYIHSVRHHGVEIYKDAKKWSDDADEWPAKFVIEDDSTFRFAQFEYRKIRLKDEPEEWVATDGCGDIGHDYVYEVARDGKRMELEISKYDNEEEKCCQSYSVDGYSFGVCPYPPKDEPIPIYDDSMVFTVVQDDPMFPGGMEAMYKYLAENIKYPLGVGCERGNVFVQFIVERDGTITDAHVLKDLCGGCGEEALRVVNSMPRWIPGKQRGKPVRVRFNIPVLFERKK